MGTDLVGGELVLGPEEVPRAAEAQERVAPPLCVDEVYSELDCLRDRRILELRRPPVRADEVGAVGLGPEGDELGDLGVDADTGQRVALADHERFIGRADRVPIGEVEVVHVQAGLLEGCRVDEPVARVHGLGDGIDLVVDGDLVDRRLVIEGRIEPAPLEALVQRHERVPRNVGRD